jgi:hypothetical protein
MSEQITIRFLPVPEYAHLADWKGHHLLKSKNGKQSKTKGFPFHAPRHQHPAQLPPRGRR